MKQGDRDNSVPILCAGGAPDLLDPAAPTPGPLQSVCLGIQATHAAVNMLEVTMSLVQVADIPHHAGRWAHQGAAIEPSVFFAKFSGTVKTSRRFVSSSITKPPPAAGARGPVLARPQLHELLLPDPAQPQPSSLPRPPGAPRLARLRDLRQPHDR